MSTNSDYIDSYILRIEIFILVICLIFCVIIMGKWEKYSKNFNKKWLSDPTLGQWIVEVPGDSAKAYCKVCRVTLRAQKADLKKTRR